jgi:hypothetical protein
LTEIILKMVLQETMQRRRAGQSLATRRARRGVPVVAEYQRRREPTVAGVPVLDPTRIHVEALVDWFVPA